jgi:hypothetical protein
MKYAAPTASDVKGPLVSVVPLGVVIVTEKVCHLSPYLSFAVGGASASQNETNRACPTPTGLGLHEMNAYVAKPVVAALADCVNTDRAENDSSRIIAVAKILFFKLFRSIKLIDINLSPKLNERSRGYFWAFKTIPKFIPNTDKMAFK